MNALDDAVPDDMSLLYQTFIQRLWIGKCDPIPENRILADMLWEKHDLEPYPSMHEDVILDVVQPASSSLRTAASVALAKCPDIDAGYTLSKILGKFSKCTALLRISGHY